MAQIDTGLGWSMEDTYASVSAGVIAGFNELSPQSPITGQPLPRVAGQSELGQLGYVYNQSINTEKTGALTDDDIFVFYYPVGTNQFAFVWVSASSTARFCTGIANGATGIVVYREWTTSTYHSTSGLYYKSSTVSGTTGPQCPQFASLAEGMAYFSYQSVTFSKVNDGYTATCVAKWKTANGTELASPILISSNTEFVDMTTTGTGNYMAKFNKLLSGVRFYMTFWDINGDKTLLTSFPQIDLTDRGNMDLEQLFMTIVSTSYAHVIIINSTDPYEGEGAGSEEEGGDGEDTGDDDAGIEAGSDFPSAINTGFCRIFSPSESELRNLSNYLWSNSYDLAQVKKLFSNPMDSILGLSAVPIRLLGSSVSFSLGGVPITGMTLPLVTQQRYTYHMGTITIKERWGSYLDYDPYTKFSIFLPFIGMRELAADDIMGKTVSLVYDIDILTGMCVARLQAGTNCLYEWGGNCAIQLPINSRNWDSVFSTAVSAVGGIVSAVTGGSAPLVAGSVASAALQSVSMKPRIDKSSTIGGAAGWLGQMTPYIIRTTPEAFIPADQNKFIGYPAYINVSLDAISGYNEVASIHLENVTATGAELEEIESILKGGVIF